MSDKSLARQIYDFVRAEGYQPQQMEQLAEAMGIGQAEFGDFRDACRALMRNGRIALGSGNGLMLAEPPGWVTGTFRANPRGFGFIIPHTPNAHGDLYVPASATSGAITGDTVRARVKKRGKRQGKMLYQGQIEEIIKRGQSRFPGRLARQFDRWYVIPEGNTLHLPIVVDDPTAKRAKIDDSVVVEITEYPDEGVQARGVIVKVLGTYGEPGVDTLTIMEQYQLPSEFPEEVLEDARSRVANFDVKKDAQGREDLRKETIITIDPDDAKDYDDAISIAENDDGTVTLGVHIADVAHFVPDGSPLDEEARERTTSVYLPGTVIPMLPEVLSNGVCSLQERQGRLTRSAFITYDNRGQVKKERVANTLIKSTKRLTYREADKILSGKPGRTSAKVVALLTKMEKLARSIQKRRQNEGMLELDLPEVELILDETGAVKEAAPADQSYPHKMIEMFMVEANEAVARTLHKAELPFLRRIHPEPAEDASGGCRKLLSLLGYDLAEDADRQDIRHLLAKVHGKPEAFTVNLAILRTMQPAEYSPMVCGHYALASEDYCHFTSPIRRYPDLTVHRLLDALIRNELNDDVVIPEKQLHDLGRACSDGERHAEAAERELRDVLVLRLLEERTGDVFQGVVTGIANVGMFVQLQDFLIEGLVSFSRLGDDWWEVDTKRGIVEGERSGHRISIGDACEVAVAAVNIPQRKLDLQPVGPLGDIGESEKSRKGKGKPKPGKSRPKQKRKGRKPGGKSRRRR